MKQEVLFSQYSTANGDPKLSIFFLFYSVDDEYRLIGFDYTCQSHTTIYLICTIFSAFLEDEGWGENTGGHTIGS